MIFWLLLLLVVGVLLIAQGTVSVFGLTDASISSAAPISDTKTVHRYTFELTQTGTVVAGKAGRINYSSGTLLEVTAAITEAQATGNYAVTVDLKKSTGGGAFASVLSSTLTLNSGNTLYVPVLATINTSSLIASDILLIVVTVSGNSGAQAQGLAVTVTLSENP